MKKKSLPILTRFILTTFLGLSLQTSVAQLMYQPYSYQFYQKLNDSVYAPSSMQHTAVKPFIISDSSKLRPLYDSLLMLNADNSKKSWFNHLLFSGHLAWVKEKDYTFFMDYLPDLQIGREFFQPKTIWLNTRGYQIYGTVGARFFFYTSGYENQGAFANYETNYINTIGMIPGEAFTQAVYGLHTDWSYVTSLIGYQFNKSVMVVLGEDKTFIGDGYRSVLLSDYAGAYPLLRFTIDLGKRVQYMAMWAYMEDRTAPQFNAFYNNRRKWGVFHYIDWTINKRASLGFFNALITEEASDQGIYHGFDVNYINPILFNASLVPAGQAPDHTLFGFNGKYKIFEKTLAYAQLLIDQSPSNGISGTRTAWQLGFKGSDLFKIARFNYLFEFNTASPYTYSTAQPIVNYAQLNEPLADPFGSNFKESIGLLNYSIGKFDLQGELLYARYGLNTTATNYGKDITQPDNTKLPMGSGGTGQGLGTGLKYAEGTVAYLLNPKYNLRIEIGALLRQERNDISDTRTAMLTLGLRSTFRDLYHDF